MPVVNKSRFNDVDFWPATRQRVVGKIGVEQLIQVGVEQGTGAMVVARTGAKKWHAADLHAVPIYELMSHTQDQIEMLSERS